MTSRLTPEVAAGHEEADLYTTLYYVLASSAPDDRWDRGWMEFEVIASDVCSFKYATFEGETKRHGFAPHEARDDAQVVFEELARRMQEAGHPAWNIARFETTRDGKMKMHFSYTGDNDAPPGSVN